MASRTYSGQLIPFVTCRMLRRSVPEATKLVKQVACTTSQRRAATTICKAYSRLQCILNDSLKKRYGVPVPIAQRSYNPSHFATTSGIVQAPSSLRWKESGKDTLRLSLGTQELGSRGSTCHASRKARRSFVYTNPSRMILLSSVQTEP